MLEYIEKGVSLVKNLVPPLDGATDIHVRRWRIWIAGATFLNAIGLSLHIALACGLAAPFYPGFAQAGQYNEVQTQMKEVKDDLREKRIQELATSLILDAKQKHCAATGEAKRLYFTAYNNLRAEYYDLTRREFPDPPCTDFQ